MIFRNSTSIPLKVGFKKEQIDIEIQPEETKTLESGETGAFQFFVFQGKTPMWFGFIADTDRPYIMKPDGLYSSDKIPNLLDSMKGRKQPPFYMILAIVVIVIMFVWWYFS